MTIERVWTNAALWTGEGGGSGSDLPRNMAIAAGNGRISWIGPAEQAPEAREVTDVAGRLVTPGLIDCHTHLIHAGSRAREWQMRLAGANYSDIAKSGGGIISTVRAVRAAGEEELLAESLPRLDALIAEGVTTIEVKSGYGLDLATEIKMLKAARRLAEMRDISVLTTYLGAHAVPPEASSADSYIAEICRHHLPEIARQGLADAVDAFCESIAFSPDQVRRLFEAAKAHALPVKIHAEQLTNSGGASVAAKFSALSADHLEYLDRRGIEDMAAAGTVAVLLPGAYYFLQERKAPPVADLERAGVPIAIATDCNPGSSPIASLLLAMNMACVLFSLSPTAALDGATRNAARALGLASETGTIEIGKYCDLAIWDAENIVDIVYRPGYNPLYRRIWHGKG